MSIAGLFKKIKLNKRNIFLLLLALVIFIEFALLISRIALKEENQNEPGQTFKLSFSTLSTTIETTISTLRYKGQMMFSKEKISLLEASKNEKQLRYVVGAIGPSKSMEMLLSETGGGSIEDCHQQAHSIGRVSYRVFKAQAFREVNYDCHSGYLHGVIEEFLNQNGTENIADKIDEMCSSLDNSFFVFECLHGSGHGMLAVNNYELKTAIADCKKLHSEYAQSSCYGGVFMENIIASQGIGAYGHVTKWVNENPHFPCTEFLKDTEVSYQCYQMQTSRMLDLYQYDFQKVAEECLKAKEGMIEVCFRSFGRDVAGNVLRNSQRIIEKCSLIKDPKYYDTCLDGALWVIMDFWGPNLTNQATELCKMVGGVYKSKCFAHIAGRMDELSFSKEKKKSICQGFDKQYQSLCRES